MQDFLYYVCWIYTCASRYDAFTRSIHSPAALILDKAVPGKGGMNWSICFRKMLSACPVRLAALHEAVVGKDRAWPPVCPSEPVGTRETAGRAPVPRVLQRPGCWTVSQNGRGDRAVGPAVAELSASGGRGDAGRSRAPRTTRPLHPPQ